MDIISKTLYEARKRYSAELMNLIEKMLIE